MATSLHATSQGCRYTWPTGLVHWAWAGESQKARRLPYLQCELPCPSSARSSPPPIPSHLLSNTGECRRSHCAACTNSLVSLASPCSYYTESLYFARNHLAASWTDSLGSLLCSGKPFTSRPIATLHTTTSTPRPGLTLPSQHHIQPTSALLCEPPAFSFVSDTLALRRTPTSLSRSRFVA